MLALVGTRRGLTKSDILGTVHGYRQTFEVAGATAALDRKFDRDKEDLRELGIDIETLDDPSAPGDNQRTRYRIGEQVRMPASVQLDADESALLSLAAAVWREGALADESRRGVTKLRSRGLDVRRDLPNVAPRLRSREPQFDALADAIAHGASIAFEYTKQGASGPEHRSVEPLALINYGGRWLLVGFDLDRVAERRFLLQRITGEIRRTGRIDADRAEQRAGRDVGRESVGELERLAAANPVVVATQRGSDAERRLARRAVERVEPDAEPDLVLLTLEMADLELLADELAGYGPELAVQRPERLRGAVAARLKRALADHDGAELDDSARTEASDADL